MTATLDVKEKMEYLATGYIKSEYLNHKDDNQFFEMSLIQVILQFLANIFVIFDCYPKGFENQILEHGQVFRWKDKTKYDLETIGCSWI